MNADSDEKRDEITFKPNLSVFICDWNMNFKTLS